MQKEVLGKMLVNHRQNLPNKRIHFSLYSKQKNVSNTQVHYNNNDADNTSVDILVHILFLNEEELLSYIGVTSRLETVVHMVDIIENSINYTNTILFSVIQK